MSAPAFAELNFAGRFLKQSLLFLILLTGTNSFAQTQPSYFFLGAKEFDGVQIYDVIQDNEYNYWIATDNGLYKYDNYHFERKAIEGSRSLSVFGFVKDSVGTIYCYNLNNQILQIRSGVCSVLYNLKSEERGSDIYLSITPENDLLVFTKTILVFGPDGKQGKLPKARLRYYGFPYVTQNGETISHVSDSDSILVYKNQTLEYRKLQCDEGKIQGVLKFFSLGGMTFAISSSTKAIYGFQESGMKFTRLDKTQLEQTEEFYRVYSTTNLAWAAGVTSGVRMLSNSTSLRLSDVFYSQYLISDVFEDAEGNLLLSTFNYGILVVPDVNIPDVLPVPGNKSIVSIQSDSTLGMLMGTLTGELLTYSNGTYTTLCTEGSRPLQSIFSWKEFPFVIFDDGFIKALNRSTGKIIPLSVGSLKDAVCVNDSLIYIATNLGVSKIRWDGGDELVVTAEPKIHLRCNALTYSPGEKVLYVATSDGVKTLDESGNLNALLLNNESFFANDICFSAGVVYLASGNCIYDCSRGKINGYFPVVLHGNKCEVSKVDVRNNKYYTITSDGFAMFDLNGNLLTHLNTQQGFETNRIYDFDYALGKIWICHSKGVQFLDESQISQPYTKPLLRLLSISVNDKSVNAMAIGGSYESDQRKFRFVLSSPTLRNKENIRYKYQLSGYDPAWYSIAYADNEIIYNALSPGDYRLTVYAENYGVMSDPVVYTFTISAPFYSRWWFTAGICIASLITITLIYRYRLQLQQRKSKLENELASSRLTAIQSQMNPHFIFNSLNSIQDLVLKGDVDNSYMFITKFSNLVRRTLNYSDKDFIEFSQEIKLLELYLSLEKLRFKEDLEFTIDTDGVEDILIPPMLIQPFIENSLLHGLLHKEGRKIMKISFELKDNLICVIEDNGIGREKAKEIKQRQRGEHESFSGEAIRKRFSILSRLFESELGYIYEDMYTGNEATGTRVKLTIPVKRSF